MAHPIPHRSWIKLLKQQREAPPLIFLHGMRHSISQGVSCQLHSHRAIEIVYHPIGQGITRFADGRQLSFSEGSAVVYAPDVLHDQVMDSKGEDLCVQMAIPPDTTSSPEGYFLVPFVNHPHLIEDLRLLSLGYVHLSPEEQTIFNLRATSTLLALIHLAHRQNSNDHHSQAESHTVKAEHYIRDHFADLNSLSEVAEHMGISHDHLRHSFKSQRGKSMARYLNEVRIERAKTLLAHSNLPLKQIATMCGFNDEYYFSSVFRTFSGTSPGKFRRQQPS